MAVYVAPEGIYRNRLEHVLSRHLLKEATSQLSKNVHLPDYSRNLDRQWTPRLLSIKLNYFIVVQLVYKVN